MNKHMKKNIQAFFDFKWKNDKSQAIDDDEEKSLLEQLPTEVQDKLFYTCLFKNFMVTFRSFFRIEK